MDISHMIESEINALIFKGSSDSEAVSMPLEIAKQVIEMPHLSDRIKDWAWDTIDAELFGSE